MRDYFLPNYNLSCLELLQSIVVSEYGLRHLRQADLQPERKWGHHLIAAIEFIPILGQIAMLVEWVAFQVMFHPDSLDSTPQKELLFKGTQEQCDGAVNPTKVLRLVNNLNQRKEHGIVFNQRKIVPLISGGTCTAMAFDFAENFFKLRKVHVMTGHYSNNLFLNSIRNLGQRFANSSEEMRIEQAAFNTIEVMSHLSERDIAKNKVQSLANLHNFKIDHASEEISVDRDNYERIVKEEVSKLPDGLYLLRTIEPYDNVKREMHGHSMIYVKNQKEGFFYDPNEGTRYMKEVDHLSELSRVLTNCHRLFNTSKARFYRLAPAALMPP
jgi:hypothetical protein